MSTYKPAKLKLWTLPSSYFGATWEGFYSSGFGQSRDSDALERSNFRAALKALEAVSERVQVVRESHWAVGWVEWIAIPADDFAALEAADGLREDYEQHPVLDENDFSNEETEEANEVWTNCYSPKERLQYIRDNRSQFDFCSFADLRACVRGEFFNGYAYELIA